MKKLMILIAVCAFTGACFAGGPQRHNRPPEVRRHDRNEGIHLATDIVRLVGGSLRLIAPQPETVIVVTQPVYRETVIITRPVYRETVIIGRPDWRNRDYGFPHRRHHEPPRGRR